MNTPTDGLSSAQITSEFDDYQMRVENYSRTWWGQTPAAIGVLREDPHARAEVLRLAAGRSSVQTSHVYRVGQGRWRGSRLRTHQEIVDTMFSDSPNFLELPIATLLLGLPGSGKSTLLGAVARAVLTRLGRTSAGDVVDADSVRAKIPEYAGGLGSVVVQVETAHLAYGQVIDRCYARGSDVVIDTVGDPEHTMDEVQYLTSSGWSVMILCTDIDVEVAVGRVKRRALDSGRFVPLDYVRSIGDRPKKAYDAVLQSGLPVFAAAMFDTSGPIDSPPTVVDSTDESLFGENGTATLLWPGR